MDRLKTKGKKMIIIAFSDKTSKILPRLLCRKIKHVAPISVHNDKLVMYQFIKQKIVVKIHLRMRDISTLQRHGWRFIYIPCDMPHDFNTKNIYTCVELAKRAIKLNAWHIQTPYALYKYLLSRY